jgi:hypothetical protein
MSEWIRFDDVLPDFHVRILTWDGCEVSEAECLSYAGAFDSRLCKTPKGEEFRATHWQPLPKPPNQ